MNTDDALTLVCRKSIGHIDAEGVKGFPALSWQRSPINYYNGQSLKYF